VGKVNCFSKAVMLDGGGGETGEEGMKMATSRVDKGERVASRLLATTRDAKAGRLRACV
jgi:hypothetical protein